MAKYSIYTPTDNSSVEVPQVNLPQPPAAITGGLAVGNSVLSGVSTVTGLAENVKSTLQYLNVMSSGIINSGISQGIIARVHLSWIQGQGRNARIVCNVPVCIGVEQYGSDDDRHGAGEANLALQFNLFAGAANTVPGAPPNLGHVAQYNQITALPFTISLTWWDNTGGGTYLGNVSRYIPSTGGFIIPANTPFAIAPNRVVANLGGTLGPARADMVLNISTLA